MTIESELARAAEDVMRAGENLVEIVQRGRWSAVDTEGIVLQLIAGHDDPQVFELRSWAVGEVEATYEPTLADRSTGDGSE